MATTSMRELFIYFRAPAAGQALLGARIAAMQGELCRAWPGLRARCLRRPAAADGLHTWMETYARDGHADGVHAELEAAIAQAARPLSALLAGERHVEVFVPVATADEPPCA